MIPERVLIISHSCRAMRWAVMLLTASSAVCQQLQVGVGTGAAHVDYVYRPRSSTATGGSGPFSGVVPGMLLMAGSTAALWWNEGRTARNEQVLRAATRQRVLESLDSTKPFDAANVGSLIHVRASPIMPGSGVQDPLFQDVRRPNALLLRRRSETFQWVETAQTLEERVSETHVKRTTTYSYHQRWNDHHVDSSSFRGDRASHRNTAPLVPPGTLTFEAQGAQLPNGVPLDPALINQLSSWQPVRLSPNDAEAAGEGDSACGAIRSDGGVAMRPMDGALVGPLDGASRRRQGDSLVPDAARLPGFRCRYG